jgi:hypothetical protein
MKDWIMKGIIVLAGALLVPQISLAQGTVYLDNLGSPSTGSLAVGSDSWLAADFLTGNNVGGYVLDSIQFSMTAASGSPGGFTARLYRSSFLSDVPGTYLGTLNGSADPSASGIYTFTPPSSLTLVPGADYYIVLTAATTVANGAYEWSLSSGSSYNPAGGWSGFAGKLQTSNNGTSWPGISTDEYPQYAIYATPVAEPSVLGLFCLGGLGFLWHRRKRVLSNDTNPLVPVLADSRN